MWHGTISWGRKYILRSCVVCNCEMRGVRFKCLTLHIQKCIGQKPTTMCPRDKCSESRTARAGTACSQRRLYVQFWQAACPISGILFRWTCREEHKCGVRVMITTSTPQPLHSSVVRRRKQVSFAGDFGLDHRATCLFEMGQTIHEPFLSSGVGVSSVIYLVLFEQRCCFFSPAPHYCCLWPRRRTSRLNMSLISAMLDIVEF